ncbi:preprotein translocase subunit YajC [Moraxella sp. FZLJ2107]|uniref:preprotein translocase subunit YajC n=1 Tax=unclassified Moraxella TaxID=2685852 RepID=UPI00209BD41C|nr:MULTISPECIES: preprotein translocase subunit YajC [unclassified Moraxella]USZ14803.1 preprotein translocase subunit YajC [Moraxella sp. FZFQ2102]UTO05508.1 preprotein translocase subunit YajC [Moraxella sp. FZLJ2107]UTO22244.1 preprotein translocase subunit YajC [Moraxella sp. FZLJ2109]
MLDLFITAAHASAGAPAGQQSLLMNLLIPVAFFAIFYFLIIRPQSKRNKQHKAMVDGLAAGNEVVFAGGLIGKIKKVEGDYAVISLGTTEVKIQKASVLMVLPAGTVDNI